MSDRAALPASWYEASVTRPPPVPALAGSVEADVCVVGGGIAGCSTALHLAERGFRVVLLEAGRIGSGASGRSGAQLLPGYACGQDKLRVELGATDARRLWDFTLEGLDLLRERIARHAIDCDLVHGQMHSAIKPRQREELLAWQREFEDDYGYASTRLIEREELTGLLATRRYCAGLLDTNGGHCHPLKYVLGLARAASEAGVALHEGNPVTAIGRGPLVTVQTATGSVRARYAVLCGNVGNIWLDRMLARKIIGVMTYIIATEPLGADRAIALITNNMAVTDINWVLDYFRRSADHRLLFGGRVSYSGVDPAGTAPAPPARMIKVLPPQAQAPNE